MGFGLIYRTWAFLITIIDLWAEWIGPSSFILGWRQKGLNASMDMPSGLGLHPWLASKGLNASMGMPLLWGLASGTASPFFKPYQLPPSPYVRRAWARTVTFLISDAIFTCLLGAGLVKA